MNDGEFLHNFSQVTINKWCAKAIHYMEHLNKKEKCYMGRLHDLLKEESYAALLD